MSYDLIIVGAGIVGAACADECARAGFKVLLLDRGLGSTTAAGMGHLVVMDDSDAQFALTSYSRNLWHQLRNELPANVEFDPCGTLWVAANEDEMVEVRRKQLFYTQRGVRVEVLDAEGVRKAEPNLRPGMVGGLRVPDDAVIYPPCATSFLLRRAKEHGAEIRTGTQVTDLLPEGGVRLSDGSRVPANRSLNATGPWSPTLSANLPVRKRKGHLVITDRYPAFIHHQIVELGYLKSAHGMSKDSVAFNVQPRKTGQILIGSSRQFDAEDTVVEQSMLDRMINRALEYMPALANLSATRTWTGHRAATPDKLPVIGPTVNCDRIWLATGHEGVGITTSLGTARILTDLLLDRPCAIPSAPYSPARFSNGNGNHEA